MKVFSGAVIFLLMAGLSYAQPANLDKAQSPPPHTDNKTTHTKEIGKPGKTVQPPSPSLPANVNIMVGGKLELSSEMKEAKAPEEKKEWFSEFFNVKATDWVIAAFTVVIGLYTIFLTKATSRLADISGHQVGMTRTIERAYIGMSHRPPGLIDIPPNNVVLGIHVEIRNVGHTPASITDAGLGVLILDETEPWPQTPPYATSSWEQAPNAFLYPDGFVVADRRFPIQPDVMEEINTRTKILVVLGYADYIDQFGQRYRSGYARRYVPMTPGDNLEIVARRGYNYDRIRQQGEGHDWNDPI